MDIIEKINKGDYESKLPYPNREDFPDKGKEDRARMKEAYRADDLRLEQQFKADALEDVGLSVHPNKEKIYSKAWADGRSSGYAQVYWALSELAEMIK